MKEFPRLQAVTFTSKVVVSWHVLDKHIETTVHKQEVICGTAIAATVMILGVCQGHSSIASFSVLTSASRSPSAIAELLVL